MNSKEPHYSLTVQFSAGVENILVSYQIKKIIVRAKFKKVFGRNPYSDEHHFIECVNHKEEKYNNGYSQRYITRTAQ